MKFADLWQGHPNVLGDPPPCRDAADKPFFEDQCAIRMGVALKAAGLRRSDLPGAVTCGHGLSTSHPPADMHFLRAQEVASALASARPSLRLSTYDCADQTAQAADRLLLAGVLLGAVLGLGLVWRAGRTAP